MHLFKPAVWPVVFFCINQFTSSPIRAEDKADDDLNSNCSALMAQKDPASDVVTMKNGTYRFVFEDRAEIDLILSQYSAGNGALLDSYLIAGDFGYVDDSKSAFHERDEVFQFQLSQLIVSTDPRKVILRSMLDNYNEYFDVILELKSDFNPDERMQVESIKFESRADDWEEFFSLYDGKFVDAGTFKPVAMLLDGYFARELVVSMAQASLVHDGEQSEILKHLSEQIPSSIRKDLKIFNYRGLYWLKVGNSYFVVVDAISPGSLSHMLSGLQGLGVRKDHPIFSTAERLNPFLNNPFSMTRH